MEFDEKEIQFNRRFKRLVEQEDWMKLLHLIAGRFVQGDNVGFRIFSGELKTIVKINTGGVAENEQLIYKLRNTLFWAKYWQVSKRGGYYKFDLGKDINK